MRARPLWFGLAGGFLFFAHAMVNNSHAWPLVWPFLAGALAVWTARDRQPASYGTDLRKAATVGLVAGAIFVVATAITLSRLDLDGGTIGLAGLTLAAVIGLLGAVLGGALVHPLARRA